MALLRHFAAVCPFLVQRLVEALELAVPARRVGRREDVPRAELGQQRLEARGWCGPCGCRSSPLPAARQPCSGIQAAARRNVAVDGDGGLGPVQLGSRPGGCGHRRPRRRRRCRRRGCGAFSAVAGAPSARAGRTWAASSCRCATAPPAAPTHSAGSVCREAARRRCETAVTRAGPCRSSPRQIPDQARQPRRPVDASERAPAGSAAPPRRSAPTDTNAGREDACAGTPAKPDRPLTACCPAMPPPMRRGHRNRTLEPPRSETSTHPRSNEPTANRPASPSLHLPSSMSGPPSKLSVVADSRTLPHLRRGRTPQPFTKSAGSAASAGREQGHDDGGPRAAAAADRRRVGGGVRRRARSSAAIR